MLGRKLGLILTVAGLAVGVAPVEAAPPPTWYAAPTAQGDGDCTSPANACPLAAAVTAADSGETVDVLGNLGPYHLGAGGVNPGSKPLHFVGTNGVPRLIANSSSPALELSAEPSSATGLYIVNNGDGDGLFVASATTSSGGFALDRLYVKTTGATTSHTCFLGGEVTLTNSVCWQANPSSSAGAVSAELADNTVRNVVAWQSGASTAIQCAALYDPADLTVVNTIARATGTGGTDLAAFSNGLFPASITVRHSNFATAAAQGSGTSMDHIDKNATDQSSMPVLANPATGNFREQSTSPTINAGVTAAANGALDLAGRPRTVAGKTDIGAYERGTPLVRPRSTRITSARISKARQSATFRFTASGRVRGFQCSLVRQPGTRVSTPKPHFVACSAPRTYRHLMHGGYVFEVRAFNAAGPARTPAIRTFRV